MPVYKKHNGKPVVGYSGAELGYTDPNVAPIMHWYYKNSDGSSGNPLSLKQENEMFGHMGYKEAKEIRKKSFGTLLAEQEGGLASSLKAAISKKTKAKIVGLKEKFDPLNIAKTLTGGSNWAPALLGKLFKIDKKRVDYFSGVKSKNTASLESSESLDSPEAVECLGYIYKSLKQSAEDKKVADEQKRNRLEQEDAEEETRNQEIIKALTGRVKKEKPYRDEKGRFAKRPTEPKEKPASFKSNPARTSNPTPSTAPTSTKTSGIGSSIVSTALKVGAGVAIVGSMSSAIGASESGGDYNISYGDRFDKKSGKIINVATDPITKKPLNLMTPEEYSGGKKLTEMTLSEVKAFGEYRSKNGAGAGAVGKYQFMPSTLFGRYDKQGKFRPGLVQQLNKSMSDKFDGPMQEELQQLLHGQDTNALKKAGVPITPGYEYMAHYIGAGGAIAVYNSINRGEDKTVAQVMMDAGYSVGNNKELYELRAVNFEKELQRRLEKKGGLSSPHSSAASGDQINKSSNDNKNLKRDVDSSNNKPTPSVVNNNVNSVKSKKQTATVTVEGFDDTNTYQKKVRQ